MDLLGMAGRRPCLPMVVCCNTRDELDAISYALSNLSYLSATPLVLSLSLYFFIYYYLVYIILGFNVVL